MIDHATSRGDRREPIFVGDGDRHALLAVLAETMNRFNAALLAYCLMGQPGDFVLHPHPAKLSRLLRHLNLKAAAMPAPQASAGCRCWDGCLTADSLADVGQQHQRRTGPGAGGQLVSQTRSAAYQAASGIRGLGFERHRNRTTIATTPLPGHRELAAAPCLSSSAPKVSASGTSANPASMVSLSGSALRRHRVAPNTGAAFVGVRQRRPILRLRLPGK